MLLVDVSGSMRANDVKPSRLGAAQSAMTTFAEKIPKQVKLALVSFSTGPDVLVMPTTDRSQLLEGVSLLSPESGTAIGDALGVAVQVVKEGVGNAPRNKEGKIPGTIVLLSDGAQTRGTLTPLEGADLARQAGIRVYTVVLGTDNGVLNFGNGGGFFGGFGFGSIAVRPDPVHARGDCEGDRRSDVPCQDRREGQHHLQVARPSIARHDVEREVSSWFVGAGALLLLASLGAARVAGGRLP